MKKETKQLKYQAPALEKGLDILEHLSSIPESASQTDIAKGMNRNPNEIYRMLMCLEERGYIRRDPITSQYQLTLKLFNLSHCHSPIAKLRETAIPLMKKLSSYANQASHITVIQDNKIMIVAPTLSPGPISVSMEEGRLYPLLTTTSGRTLLAQFSKEEREILIAQLPEYTGMNEEEKEIERQLLDKVNTDRFLIRKSNLTQGVTDIAVIIGNDSTAIKASLSLCCIDSQLNRVLDTKELTKATIETANRIAKLTGSI